MRNCFDNPCDNPCVDYYAYKGARAFNTEDLALQVQVLGTRSKSCPKAQTELNITHAHNKSEVPQ
jgi:hypothetical protein